MMTRKNKLYKHHKSKSYFLIKDFSFALITLIGLGVGITVPTYIATQNAQEISTKAESEKAEKEENKDDLDNKEEEKELLHY